MEEEMATHSDILVWRIPWTEEPGGLQSMGLQSVKEVWPTEHTRTHMVSRDKSFTFCVLRVCTNGFLTMTIVKEAFVLSRATLIHSSFLGRCTRRQWQEVSWRFLFWTSMSIFDPMWIGAESRALYSWFPNCRNQPNFLWPAIKTKKKVVQKREESNTSEWPVC